MVFANACAVRNDPVKLTASVWFHISRGTSIAGERGCIPALFIIAKTEPKSLITFSDDRYSALNDADGLIVVTEWKEFRTLDLIEIQRRMKGAVIFDGRNIYDPMVLNKAGLTYCGIGRGNSMKQL